MSVSEWQALVVNEVDEKHLLRSARQEGAAGLALPMRKVTLPVDDISALGWCTRASRLSKRLRCHTQGQRTGHIIPVHRRRFD
jgi:hypothetical protein